MEIEVEYTYKYMEVIGCESVKSGLVTEDFIHIIVTAYFNGMFEVVRHNMDQGRRRSTMSSMLNRYHMAGLLPRYLIPQTHRCKSGCALSAAAAFL